MLIVGLGNPGNEYRDTRHNVGFIAIERLAVHYRTTLGSEKGRARVAEFGFKGQHHLLLEPMTYMNLSGEAVVPALRRAGLAAADLLVIVDDIALPVGRARLRASGGAGGHNGLTSIEQHLGTTQYWRLRIGVGAAPGPGRMVDHVLGPFSPLERELIDKVVQLLPEGISMWLAGFGARAMERINRIDTAAPPPVAKEPPTSAKDADSGRPSTPPEQPKPRRDPTGEPENREG